MRVLLTGGSGDLGQVLIPDLYQAGHIPIIFDIEAPVLGRDDYFKGSLLNVSDLELAQKDIDLVIHIAAWHGIHETRGWKNPSEFWALNVNGTHNLLQACLKHGVSKLIHISSSSVTKLSGYYGFTKRLAEQAVQHYQLEYGFQTVILRPRAFIPHWNQKVYVDYLDWARRFWPGAVHISDVAQAVLKTVNLFPIETHTKVPILTIDREPDYPQSELDNWDRDGPGSSFRSQFGEFSELAKRLGLDITVKPLSMDIAPAKQVLSYNPQFGLRDLLQELSKF